MNIFFENMLIAIGAFLCCYLAGLGPSLVLLPSSKKSESFLLAPLIGMSLLVLIGLLEITVFLIPLSPRINTGFLMLVSFLVGYWFYQEEFQNVWRHFRQKLIYISLPFFILIMVFAWLFHHGGYHLLVGSSDQLQYSENARQINEEMHTGSIKDVPVARQDYYVYENNTRPLPYLITYRRGAEVMIATLAAITSLSYEEAFPVVILCGLLTLSLALNLMGRVFFQLSPFACFTLAGTFLSSFYFFLLQIQGSLAMALAIAPCLVTLSFLFQMVRDFSWRWFLLTGISMAAYMSIYAEPALVTMIIPSLFLVMWQFRKSIRSGFIALRSIAALYLLVVVCAPFAVFSVIMNALGNLYVIYVEHKAIWATSSASIQKMTAWFYSSEWNPVAVLLGWMSYYDVTAVNYKIATFLANYPGINSLGFFCLAVFALLGFFKTNHLLGRIFAVILFIWIIATMLFAYHHDPLRLVRSAQYALPFSMLGLVFLSCGANQFNQFKNGFAWTMMTWVGRLSLIGFIYMNVCTSARTISFITSHNVSNDPILLRFDDQGFPWQQLKEELRFSAKQNAPVLISGFKETIRPFAISIMVRSQPHVLGDSIDKFWAIYREFRYPLDFSDICFDISSSQLDSLLSTHLFVFEEKGKLLKNEFCATKTKLENKLFNYFSDYNLAENPIPVIDRIMSKESTDTTKSHQEYKPTSFFNTRLSHAEFQARQEQERQPWLAVIPRLFNRSLQAVVPVGYGLPEEWADSRDIYPPRITRFVNIGDVIYRYEYAASFDKEIISALKKDEKGLFRLLMRSGRIELHANQSLPQRLTMIYEGNVDDIKLQIRNHVHPGEISADQGQIKVSYLIRPEEIKELNVLVAHPIKLRAITLSTLTA